MTINIASPFFSPTPLLQKPQPQNPRKISFKIHNSKNPIKYPTLDRHASSHHHLRFVRKLSTLLLSKPKRFLPIKILSDHCRPYLTVPPPRPILPLILRYPTIFSLLREPSLSVTLTPEAASLFSTRSEYLSSLAKKLQKLLLLSSHRRLLLSKLVHIAPDLGFPPNFGSRLCNAHPDLFRVVDTSYGRAVELVGECEKMDVMVVNVEEDELNKPIIERPDKFRKVKLRRGLNVKRKEMERLVRFKEMRKVNPYVEKEEEMDGVDMMERRACAVVREVLGMTVEKRSLVDHLTHFRKEFGLPNRLRAMLVRHPEMFYVSIKGDRDSVFLMEAYDEKGKLLVEDEMLFVKKGLVELVREGKRIRRHRKKGIGLYDNKVEVNGKEEGEERFEDDYDDGFDALFEGGVDEDWEEFGDDDEEEVEKLEFWSSKAGSLVSSESLEVW